MAADARSRNSFVMIPGSALAKASQWR